MADASNQGGGVYLSTKTISVLVGCFSLLASFYYGVTKVNSYDFRLEKLETEKVQLSSTIDALIKEVKDLNGKIVELTISINSVQIRQGYDRGNPNVPGRD